MALDNLLHSQGYQCNVLAEGVVKLSPREKVQVQDHSRHA